MRRFHDFLIRGCHSFIKALSQRFLIFPLEFHSKWRIHLVLLLIDSLLPNLLYWKRFCLSKITFITQISNLWAENYSKTFLIEIFFQAYLKIRKFLSNVLLLLLVGCFRRIFNCYTSLLNLVNNCWYLVIAGWLQIYLALNVWFHPEAFLTILSCNCIFWLNRILSFEFHSINQMRLLLRLKGCVFVNCAALVCGMMLLVLVIFRIIIA